MALCVVGPLAVEGPPGLAAHLPLLSELEALDPESVDEHCRDRANAHAAFILDVGMNAKRRVDLRDYFPASVPRLRASPNLTLLVPIMRSCVLPSSESL